MNKISKILKIYKYSTEEIIPKEWNVKRLSQLGTIYSGGTPDTENKEYWDGNIFWCTPSDITQLQSKYIQSTENKITNKGLQNSSATLLPIKSIIVCTRATIGNAAITNIELATNQGFKNIIPNKCNTEWLFYSIIFNKLKLKRLGCGSTFLEISKKDFENFKLLAPPLEEQKKIAEILSTWDEAIEKQSKLIEKLELRKRGIMQRLLTGRTRLSGFTTPWQKVKLGDICSITTGKLDANAMNNNGIYPFFTCAKEVYKINQFAFDTEALLISGNGEHLGYVHYYKGKFNAYQRTYVLNNFTQDIFYMFYTLKQNLPKRILQTKSSSNTPYIIMETLTNMEIILPDNQEQKSIANTLTTIDEEINIQVKKLETFRTQKCGLMQQLLTGKTRVNF